MEKTNSYTYFCIGSEEKIDTKEITEILKIKPFKNCEKDDLLPNGEYVNFSLWCAEKSIKNMDDICQQCKETILNFKNKLPELEQIKEKYKVEYSIVIVAQIYEGDLPDVFIDNEIIDFCYKTGTSLDFDMNNM